MSLDSISLSLFQRSLDAYVQAVRECGDVSYEGIVRRLGSGLPLFWFEEYRGRHPTGYDVDRVSHGAYTFLYDSGPSDAQTGGLDDRVVVAFGSSVPKPDVHQLLDELELSLKEGPSIRRDAAASSLKNVIEQNHLALPDSRAGLFEAAIEEALGPHSSGGPPSGVLLRLLSTSARLNEGDPLAARLREHVAPLLRKDPWPRDRRAAYQYSRLSKMLSMDVGHFMAHAACGGADINTFPQSPAFNRGRSSAGRIYRQMERYVARHAGVFHFSRPVYADGTWVPAFIEWGALIDLDRLPAPRGTQGQRLCFGGASMHEVGPGLAWWVGLFANEDGA